MPTLEQTKQNLEVKRSTRTSKINLLDNFDPEILDLVVVLNHLGFNTFSSCQGHIDDRDHGGYQPFILFCSKNAEEINCLEHASKNKEVFLAEYPEMLKIQTKLIDYIDEFYTHRNTPMRNRLIVETCFYCRTAIEPYFSKFGSIIKSKEKQRKLNKIYLKEIHDFCSFLESKV